MVERQDVGASVPDRATQHSPSPDGLGPSGEYPSRNEVLVDHIRAEAESRLVIDIARHASERIHEVIKLHAMTMPTVSAAVGLALVVAQQIYAETLQFAANSMDGDADDIDAIRDSIGVLMRDLLDVIDIPEINDWSNAEHGRFCSAQAIEARSAETHSGSVHESAVPQGCAQPPAPTSPTPGEPS